MKATEVAVVLIRPAQGRIENNSSPLVENARVEWRNAEHRPHQVDVNCGFGLTRVSIEKAIRIIANVKDFAPRWLVISIVSIMVIANTFNIAADLAAMGGALSLVIGGLNREHALIFAATSVLLQVFVRYRRYAPALKFLTLVLFLYVATAFTVHISWGEAFARAVWPAAEVNRDYLLMVVAVLGTT